MDISAPESHTATILETSFLKRLIGVCREYGADHVADELEMSGMTKGDFLHYASENIKTINRLECEDGMG